MPERNTVTWNTMITGYFKSGGVEKAKRVFQEMPVKDVKSWSSMVAGFMGSGKWEEGLMVFREMMVKEVFRPDEVMLGSVFSGCACMGSLGLLAGKSSHGFVAKNGWELNVELGTVLIDMYAKCGLLKSAVRVFERMSARNVMSWSAMICGLAQHGCGEEALLMFKKMKGSGVRPNEITFTGILSACTHSGLVEEGLKNYEEMIEHYRLEPRIQHYGCIVDLLGKAGRLEEAYGIVKTMKLEPNVIVWSSLLVACRLHKQFDIGERVIEQVLKVVKPERDGGVYGLVSDLYASSGKWDYALRVREMMVSQNVKKVRGSSVVRS
ncbi:hypothetical protein GIB67_016054 [Kingdonia uniflora]|uniref:Pentatricopeptide repeat-containing protein n=1 Tax=Kingdonia uniflora TaxID=39325 RepID=A0A7J7L1Z6_9MAGN|nr:hypothetical protein GIB67_016054 [Kingdonia uniflora]